MATEQQEHITAYLRAVNNLYGEEIVSLTVAFFKGGWYNVALAVKDGDNFITNTPTKYQKETFLQMTQDLVDELEKKLDELMTEAA